MIVSEEVTLQGKTEALEPHESVSEARAPRATREVLGSSASVLEGMISRGKLRGLGSPALDGRGPLSVAPQAGTP